MNNDYCARIVAPKDVRACEVCHKPTSTVLYAASGPDWLYICNAHLQDNPSFVTPSYTAEYQSAVERLKQVKQQMDGVTKRSTNTSSWDGWMANMFAKKKGTKKEAEDGSEADKEAPPDQLSALSKVYNDTLDEVARLQKQNKRYKLNETIFNARVQHKQHIARIQEQKRQQQESYTNTDPDELLQKFTFPEVPK